MMTIETPMVQNRFRIYEAPLHIEFFKHIGNRDNGIDGLAEDRNE